MICQLPFAEVVQGSCVLKRIRKEITAFCVFLLTCVYGKMQCSNLRRMYSFPTETGEVRPISALNPFTYAIKNVHH